MSNPVNGPVTVTPLKDGPNEVSGANIVKDEAGNVIQEGEKTYLCRCGFSKNKPFCDGSHKREGWTSD
jgi:CDGSH-type Zn-finger protein